MNAKTSIEEQYKDDSYSRFVESAVNSVTYNDYYHYSFFVKLNELMNQFVSQKRKKQDTQQRPPSTTIIRILDIGCGNCILGRKIIREFAAKYSSNNNNNKVDVTVEIVGLDVSLAMLEEARRLCTDENISLSSQICIRQGLATNIPNDLGGKFDLIISGFFFVHAETKQQLQELFQQIACHLKSGGTTIHIIPSPKEMEEEEDISTKKQEEDGRVVRAMLPLFVPPKAYNDEDDDGNNSSIDNNNLVLEKEIELFDHFWRPATYKSTAEQAGLVDFSWEEASIAPNSKLSSEDVLPIRVCILEAKKP